MTSAWITHLKLDIDISLTIPLLYACVWRNVHPRRPEQKSKGETYIINLHQWLTQTIPDDLSRLGLSFYKSLAWGKPFGRVVPKWSSMITIVIIVNLHPSDTDILYSLAILWLCSAHLRSHFPCSTLPLQKEEQTSTPNVKKTDRPHQTTLAHLACPLIEHRRVGAIEQVPGTKEWERSNDQVGPQESLGTLLHLWRSPNWVCQA